MIQFSYNLSQPLRFGLASFESLRHDVLIVALSPQHELRLRWDSMIRRLDGILDVSQKPVSKRELLTVLSGTKLTRTVPSLSLVIGVKNALDEIRQNWLVTQKTVSIQTIESLIGLTFGGGAPIVRRMIRAAEGDIRKLLEYMDAKEEHPLVQAAIFFLQLRSLTGSSPEATMIACLLFELVLSKYGADCRGLCAVELVWSHDKESFRAVTERAIASGNFTPWLEYAVQTSVTELERVKEKLAEVRVHYELPAVFYELNERQKATLSILDNPEATITNRQAQKRFKISQITASRDLSKLAQLGLLYPHGKGRSIYYTKI